MTELVAGAGPESGASSDEGSTLQRPCTAADGQGEGSREMYI